MGFHEKFEEKAEFNQYWYSKNTVDVMVGEMVRIGAKNVAFLSTPSLFFSAVDAGIEGHLFDFDDKLDKGDGKFVFYDYNKPDVGVGLWGSFDLVVVDAPFITREVLAAYAKTSEQLLVKDGGKVILSSIFENKVVVKELFGQGMESVNLKPSIPSLVYQYSLFVNYENDDDS